MMLKRIWQVRDLLLSLVRRDLLVRYQSSVLGFFWSFAKPLALAAIFTIAFQYILRVGEFMPNRRVSMALHMLVGVLAWSYFARCVSESHWSILNHSNLIKKVPLALEVFPTSVVIGNLIDYLLGMVVVFPVIFFMLLGSEGHGWLLIAPQFAAFLAVTALLTVLALSLALIVSVVNVYYRDMASISEVALQAWFYATPIVYPLTLVSRLFEEGRFPKWLEILYWLNPLTPICAAYRRILLYRIDLETPDRQLLFYLGIACLTVTVLFYLAQILFRRASVGVADEV